MLGSLGVVSGWSGHSDLTNLANLTNLAKPKTLLDGNERFCSRGARYPAAITSVTAPSKTRILEPKSTQLANVNLSMVPPKLLPVKACKGLQTCLCYFVLFSDIVSYSFTMLYSPYAKKLQTSAENSELLPRPPMYHRGSHDLQRTVTVALIASPCWIRRERLPNPAPWTLRSQWE